MTFARRYTSLTNIAATIMYLLSLVGDVAREVGWTLSGLAQ